MIEPLIIITNNKLIVQNLGIKYDTINVESKSIDVLKFARDYIHRGHRLLTHPLMGSIKPNETPYKTVLISKVNGKTIDMESLLLIEAGIHTTEKFLNIKAIPNWTEKIHEDFRLIDYDLIYHAIN